MLAVLETDGYENIFLFSDLKASVHMLSAEGLSVALDSEDVCLQSRDLPFSLTATVLIVITGKQAKNPQGHRL